jgi:hypothetical protein
MLFIATRPMISLVPSPFNAHGKGSGETRSYSILVPRGQISPRPIRLQKGATSTGKPSLVDCAVFAENYARVHRIDELGTETPMSRITNTAIARIGTTFYGLSY